MEAREDNQGESRKRFKQRLSMRHTYQNTCKEEKRIKRNVTSSRSQNELIELLGEDVKEK